MMNETPNATPRQFAERYLPDPSTPKLEALRQIVATLRDPGIGCPWFQRQTHAAMKPEVVEEAAEVVCGINVLESTGNAENLKEELGDLLLQVVLHAQLAAEQGRFTLDDVIQTASDKLVRRHPWVFTEEKFDSYDALVERYLAIKKVDKAGKEWIEAEYLPGAFEESIALVRTAQERKARGRGITDRVGTEPTDGE